MLFPLSVPAFGMGRVPSGGGPSRRGRSVLPVEEAFEVEGDVGEADLGLGAFDADGGINSPMRCFCVAKTCSTAERTLERAALARWRWAGSGLPGDRRKWIFDSRPARRIARSFFWLR